MKVGKHTNISGIAKRRRTRRVGRRSRKLASACVYIACILVHLHVTFPPAKVVPERSGDNLKNNLNFYNTP
jgi:transcription initiation factor TFIIIB Brf1 subunit/transcription initiation factor TFIIB